MCQYGRLCARMPRVRPTDPRASSAALAAKTLRRAATCACETPTRACVLLHTHALRRAHRARFAVEARPQRPSWRQQPPLSTTRTQRAAARCRVHIHACPGTFPAAGCHWHRVAAIQCSGPLHGPPQATSQAERLASKKPATPPSARRGLGHVTHPPGRSWGRATSSVDVANRPLFFSRELS